ncbi:MAG: (2Fe-2S) ferredoxin domain-containing protein [Clostridiales bacterium]|nr:(2Fe-2S) ferredoxin domain-containing protein [Clostridiales bacterium]
MDIKVCIGSSCHLRGSYEVIEKLKKLVADNGLEGKVNLGASFCLGKCGTGVTVTGDGEFWENVTPDTVEEIFRQKVLQNA